MSGDTHDCDNCHGEENPNPLDACGRERIGCDNPCHAGPHNTARCESLPSQIENFTQQFFGTVVKTQVNGVVTWSLPCGLDVGLPANPRGVDEGLACYFLRLFANGITGLKGAKGSKGTSGTNGTNGYAVLKQSFVQPAPGTLAVQFVIFPNPAIVAGLGVFIPGSGDYTVTAVQPGGVVFAMLGAAVPNPLATIPAGTLVIPSGLPGSKGDKGDTGATGVQGPQGIQGIQGPIGLPVTVQNGLVYPPPAAGAFNITDTFSAINFGGFYLAFVIPESGRYLVTVTLPILTTLKTTIYPPAITGVPELVYVQGKLTNSTTVTDIPGSATSTGFVFTDTGQLKAGQLVIHAIVAASLGETISVMAQTVTGTAWATFTYGSLSWVRIA